MMNYHILFIKIIFAILNCSLFSQVIERGDPNFRRQTDIDVNKIRADFPILSRKVNGQDLVYFDNAATSQTPNQVIEAIVVRICRSC